MISEITGNRKRRRRRMIVIDDIIVEGLYERMKTEAWIQ